MEGVVPFVDGCFHYLRPFFINQKSKPMELTEMEKIKEARRLYQRKWRKENPERAAEHDRRYWLKKFEELQQEAKPE